MNLETKQLTKKEKRELKRQEKEKRQNKTKFKKKIKKIYYIAAGAFLVISGVILAERYFSKIPSPQEEKIIAKNGLHWHPKISISISGKKEEIPANIGIGIVEKPIHTHEPGGIIHLEFTGEVKEDDIRLSKFFEIWGKQFNKNCIFDKCSGPEGQVKMSVNGAPNSEFENYIMKDGDEIEIIFE